MTTSDDQNPTTSGLPSYGSVPPPSQGSDLPPPPQGPPAPGGYGGAPQLNKKSLWSMIVGIASLALGLFFGPLVVGSIVAIVLGFMGRSEIAQSNGTETGNGQALTGIITGSVLIVLVVVGIILIASGVFDHNLAIEN